MDLLLMHIIHVSIEVRDGTKASIALLALVPFGMISLVLTVEHCISTTQEETTGWKRGVTCRRALLDGKLLRHV